MRISRTLLERLKEKGHEFLLQQERLRQARWQHFSKSLRIFGTGRCRSASSSIVLPPLKLDNESSPTFCVAMTFEVSDPTVEPDLNEIGLAGRWYLQLKIEFQSRSGQTTASLADFSVTQSTKLTASLNGSFESKNLAHILEHFKSARVDLNTGFAQSSNALSYQAPDAGQQLPFRESQGAVGAGSKLQEAKVIASLARWFARQHVSHSADAVGIPVSGSNALLLQQESMSGNAILQGEEPYWTFPQDVEFVIAALRKVLSFHSGAADDPDRGFYGLTDFANYVSQLKIRLNSIFAWGGESFFAFLESTRPSRLVAKVDDSAQVDDSAEVDEFAEVARPTPSRQVIVGLPTLRGVIRPWDHTACGDDDDPLLEIPRFSLVREWLESFVRIAIFDHKLPASFLEEIIRDLAGRDPAAVANAIACRDVYREPRAGALTILCDVLPKFVSTELYHLNSALDVRTLFDGPLVRDCLGCGHHLDGDYGNTTEGALAESVEAQILIPWLRHDASGFLFPASWIGKIAVLDGWNSLSKRQHTAVLKRLVTTAASVALTLPWLPGYRC